MEEIKVGDDAIEFTLKDQDGNEVSLSQFSGMRILLSFHPLAWTGICAEQMKSLEANKKTLDSLNTQALGMSVDTAPSKKAWAESLGIKTTRLLSDFWPHGEIARKYGIFIEEKGISKRANILMDENQKVIFVKVYEIKTLPDMDEIVGFIKGL
jgi:peroxiredoxin